MNSPQLTTQFVRHAVNAAAAAALALGVVATTLAPSSALAGPLNPGRGPTITPDLTPELSGPLQYGNGVVAVTASVRNTGSTAAQPVRLRVQFPGSFTAVQVGAAHESLRCTTAGTVVTCSMTRPLQGGESVGVAVDGRPPRPGAFRFSVMVDPNGEVKEVNESNNTAAVSGMFR